MTLTLHGYDLGAVDTGVIITDISKASAFQRAGREITLARTGSAVKTISDVTSYGVGEGGAKTASGNSASVKVGANKFAAVIVRTDEEWQADGEELIADALYSDAVSAHAKAFDAMVAGLTAVPAAFDNFGTLAAATEVEIDTDADASVSLDDAFAAVANGNGNAIVLTTSMLAYLRRQRVAATGQRAIDIIGNNDSGVIEGVPYFTIVSTTPVGFVGDFSNRYVWGARNLFETDTIRVKDSGTISDSDGEEHNLTSENKTALFHELLQGSGVAGIANFAKIVPAAVEPGDDEE